MKSYAQEAKRLKQLADAHDALEREPKAFQDIMSYQEDFQEKLLQEQKELESTVEILKDQIFEIKAKTLFFGENPDF